MLQQARLFRKFNNKSNDHPTAVDGYPSPISNFWQNRRPLFSRTPSQNSFSSGEDSPQQSHRNNSDESQRPVIQVQPRELGPVTEFHQNDVICGRGGRINGHCGNIQFRKFCSEKQQEYFAKGVKKSQKAHIAASVIARIRALDPPGRFLKLDGSTGQWFDVGCAKATTKAAQAIREHTPTQEKTDPSSPFLNNNSMQPIQDPHEDHLLAPHEERQLLAPHQDHQLLAPHPASYQDQLLDKLLEQFLEPHQDQSLEQLMDHLDLSGPLSYSGYCPLQLRREAQPLGASSNNQVAAIPSLLAAVPPMPSLESLTAHIPSLESLTVDLETPFLNVASGSSALIQLPSQQQHPSMMSGMSALLKQSIQSDKSMPISRLNCPSSLLRQSDSSSGMSALLKQSIQSDTSMPISRLNCPSSLLQQSVMSDFTDCFSAMSLDKSGLRQSTQSQNILSSNMIQQGWGLGLGYQDDALGDSSTKQQPMLMDQPAAIVDNNIKGEDHVVCGRAYQRKESSFLSLSMASTLSVTSNISLLSVGSVTSFSQLAL